MGVLMFQGNQLSASNSTDAKAQLTALVDKYTEETTQEVEVSEPKLQAPVIVADASVQPKETTLRKVQPSSADATNSQNTFLAQTVTPQYECSLTAFEEDRYEFEVLTPQISYQVDPGGTFETVVYVKNTGSNNWCSEATKGEAGRLRLGTAYPQDRQSAILTGASQRVSMNAPEGLILPGETAAFIIKGTAPSQPGIYREFFQPVAEEVGWFDQVKISFDLYVTGYSQEDLQKVNYLQVTGNTNELNLDDKLYINIDLATQMEYIYKGDKLIHSYLVSSGAYDTPTPVGEYEVYNKQTLRIGGASPHYRMPYWIGLKRPGGRFRGYGIHALPYLGNDKNSSYFWKEAVDHLGIRVSHGCIRRSDSDAEWLWHLVDPDNTRIEVFRSFDQLAFENKLFAGEV
jgi:lipoprotein-anchoring transpeptidase ErfK/SrfK